SGGVREQHSGCVSRAGGGVRRRLRGGDVAPGGRDPPAARVRVAFRRERAPGERRGGGCASEAGAKYLDGCVRPVVADHDWGEIMRKLLTLVMLVAAARSASADLLCVKAAGRTRSIRIRADGCKASEISLGSFDGTTLQLSGINLQIVSGSGATDAAVNGRGNLVGGDNRGGWAGRAGPPKLQRGNKKR